MHYREKILIVLLLSAWADKGYIEAATGLVDEVRRDTSRPTKAAAPNFSFADVIEKVLPSVVTVFSTKFVPTESDTALEGAFDLGRSGEKNRVPEAMHGTGSGVIVTSSGYVLTNDHVVAGADRLNVRVPGRAGHLTATIVGSDPLTDIALLKIEAMDLPPLICGDSALIRSGDVALALGSPFGLEQTVTLGIVSATGRTMNFIQGGFEDFIQTDASINPGNSGGALVDGLGRLIGINSARFPGDYGGGTGIGFAIPVNLALRVAHDLQKHGHVRRGFLGVKMLSSELPDSPRFPGRKESGPVRVVELEAGGPADKAGFQMNDLIIALNGIAVVSLEKLRYTIAVMEPGTEALFQVKRRESLIDLKATLIEAPAIAWAQTVRAQMPAERVELLQPGLEISDLTDERRFEKKIPSSVKGVFVSKALDNNGKALAALFVGDVITSINGKEAAKTFTAVDLFRVAPAGTVMLKVWKEGEESFAAVKKSQGATNTKPLNSK